MFLRRSPTSASRTRTTDLLPLEELRQITMAPVLEAWSGGALVVVARESGSEEVSFAWFELTPDGLSVRHCELHPRETARAYRRFLEKKGQESTLARVDPPEAKTRVFRAVWAGEREGHLPPRDFPMVAALLDGIEISHHTQDGRSAEAATEGHGRQWGEIT